MSKPLSIAPSQQQHIHKSPTRLPGMEQTLPPPQKKKTSQSPNHYKPLPPPPSATSERRMSLSPPRTPYAFQHARPRRTSSIYSRTPSAWFDSKDTPEVPSITEHPLPRINSVYREPLSPSATMSEPQLLLPRTYSPLPPSSMSRKASPGQEPANEQRPSVLLPPPVQYPLQPKVQLQTVSLAQARASQEAPGTEHLLPEELRARTIAKARSSEHITKLTDHLEEKPQKPGSAFRPQESSTVMRLPSMMMFDTGTWHHYDPSQRKSAEALSETTYVSTKEKDQHWSSSTAAVPLSRVTSHTRNDSHTTSASQPGSVSDEPARGRTMHRVSRSISKAKAQPSNAGNMADEYTSLVAGPWDNHSSSPSPARSLDLHINSNLTPQPLFAMKPAAGLPGTMHDKHVDSKLSSISPMRSNTPEDWDAEDSVLGTPPPPKFFFPDSDDDERAAGGHSRTGSIPISPPAAIESELTLEPSPPPAIPRSAPRATSNARLSSAQTKKQYRESNYYPYVGRRRYGKSKNPATATSTVRAQPSLAMHAARAAAQATESPAARAPSSSKKLADVQDLLARATTKASQLAEKLKRPLESGSPSPGSPANLGQSVTAVYLGWSAESKDEFDASKPISPKPHYAANKFAPGPAVKQTYTHVVTPARPLDERPVALAETSEPTKQTGHIRRPSLFDSLLELSREKGREKRRENIKRTITVIPNAAHDALAQRPVLEPKSASEADVRNLAQTVTPPRGLWERRASEFGLI